MKHWETQNLISFNKISKSKDLFDYHQNITVPIAGYTDVKSLFETYRVAEGISQLQVPALIMMAEDDPIVSIQDIPYESMGTNSKIKVVRTKHGSHCCWFEGIVPRRWYPKPTLQFLKGIRDTPPLSG